MITYHGLAALVFHIGLFSLIGGTWWLGRPNENGEISKKRVFLTVLVWIICVPIVLAGLIGIIIW